MLKSSVVFKNKKSRVEKGILYLGNDPNQINSHMNPRIEFLFKLYMEIPGAVRLRSTARNNTTNMMLALPKFSKLNFKKLNSDFFFSLSLRQAERQRELEFPPAQQWSQTCSHARSKELTLGFPSRWQEPSHLNCHHHSLGLALVGSWS